MQINDSFYSRMSNQTLQWNGMIHFTLLFIPLPRLFHFIIYLITPYQTDPKVVWIED
ncbi:hypothetical protein Hanom_Chr03g00232761 [Helianthus anomalus]